ncbi:IclR family transcriptional regulator [Arthrobacter sp. TS-15]|uniref:IclR family transcriptional regulator n=1 Tax=Arthrobacter sp. TS-15 TaxID=2510797 RepID=UPI00115E400B|nr:IclR family transcriptional regulator [Arthrobacter sp. TS-15]TQS87381.1 IclR family transcriptional regulator [Arthrobacter sp. TS-15]
MAGGSREPGRTATSRVLAILEAFEKSRGSLSLTDIAQGSGLPLSTAHRLVNELTDWGFLSRDPNGRYQLGIRLWELAQNTGRQLRDAARPYVQDLFSLTGETAHLAVRAGQEVLYIDRVYGSKRVPRASRVGGRLPMHATAVGKVILAFEEDWVRDAYLNRQLERHTAHTHVDPRRLADEIVQIHEQGYAMTLEEVRLGSCSIAVPIIHSGKVGAGLGLVLPTSQAATMTRHLAVLKGIAAQIERATARIPLETLLGGHIQGKS